MSERFDANDIRHKILSAMLLISAAACVVAMTVNAINQRPWENLVFPGVACILLLILNYLSQHKGQRGYLVAKYGALTFLNVLYVPASWLTSPGSTSAMPYYALVIFTLGVILADKKWDLALPAITLAEVLVLLRIEGLYPQWFDVYTDPVYRLFDLTVNFFVVGVILFVMLYMLTRHYSQHHEQLYHLSITDPLTGLYNRRHMMSTLEAEHNSADRTGQPYSIILIDINHFKRVNDTYGHLEGDSTLRMLGSILQHESRSYDVCCRYGGDEFMIILPRTAQKEALVFATRINERFLSQVERFKDLEISLSIGITERKDQTLKEIIAIADDRLYQRKKGQ